MDTDRKGKAFLFANDMILYMRESIGRLIGLTNNFNKAEGYKMNTYKKSSSQW